MVASNPRPPAVGIVRAVLAFTQDGQQVVNVLNYEVIGGEPAPVVQEVLGRNLVTWWTTRLRTDVANNVRLRQVDTYNLASAAAAGTTTVPEILVASGSQSAALPNSCTLVMTWRTGFRGRSYRGRTYHIGLSEGQVENNLVSAVTQNNLLTKYQEIIDIEPEVVGGPRFRMVVLSYVNNKLERVVPLPTPVTSVSTDGIIDAQRRRLPGRGA